MVKPQTEALDLDSPHGCSVAIGKHGTVEGIGRATGLSASTVRRRLVKHIKWKGSRVPGDLRGKRSPQLPAGNALVSLLHKRRGKELTLLEAANLLDCAPSRVEGMAEAAAAEGYAVEFADNALALHRAPTSLLQTVKHNFFGKHFKFGIFGDTHVGSIFEAEGELDQYFAFCRKEGVEALYAAGDITDGNNVYRGQLRELRPGMVDIDAQVERAAQRLVSAGLPVYFIGGNHDLRAYADLGFDVGGHIMRRAKELAPNTTIEYLGPDKARVEIGQGDRTCILDLQHPGGGTAYAISYRSQKIVEEYTGGDKPHIVAIGHFHKSDLMPHVRNMVAMQAGCFCWQTRFMGRQQIAPHVGGWVVEGWIDMLGGKPSLTRLRAEFLKFYLPARHAAG